MSGGTSPVFVISGQLAAGKSTLAEALMRRYPRGLHVNMDGVREMVVSGLASPLEWTPETDRQFGLAAQASAKLAAIYHRGGFAAAIEGGMDPQLIDPWLAEEGLDEVAVKVVLVPRLEVAMERNRSRTNKSFDTSILDEAIFEIDRTLRDEPLPADWVGIDNSDEAVDATVERVLALVPAPLAPPA